MNINAGGETFICLVSLLARMKAKTSKVDRELTASCRKLTES